MAALDYAPSEFEVLVVDDGSDPPCDSIGASYATHLNIRCLRRSGQGPATARKRHGRALLRLHKVLSEDSLTESRT